MTLEDVKSTLGKENSSIDPREIDYYVDDCGEPWPVDELELYGAGGDFGEPWPVDEFEIPYPEDANDDLTPEELQKIIDYYREIKDYYREEKDKYVREMKKAAEESILPEEAAQKHIWIMKIKGKMSLRSLSEDKMER